MNLQLIYTYSICPIHETNELRVMAYIAFWLNFYLLLLTIAPKRNFKCLKFNCDIKNGNELIQIVDL